MLAPDRLPIWRQRCLAGGGSSRGVAIRDRLLDTVIVSLTDEVSPIPWGFDNVHRAVVAALVAIGEDPMALDRMTFAVTLAHTESGWVQETAFQLLRLGVPPRLLRRRRRVRPRSSADWGRGLIQVRPPELLAESGGVSRGGPRRLALPTRTRDYPVSAGLPPRRRGCAVMLPPRQVLGFSARSRG